MQMHLQWISRGDPRTAPAKGNPRRREEDEEELEIPSIQLFRIHSSLPFLLPFVVSIPISSSCIQNLLTASSSRSSALPR